MKISNLLVQYIYFFAILFSCPFFVHSHNIYVGQLFIYAQIFMLMFFFLFLRLVQKKHGKFFSFKDILFVCISFALFVSFYYGILTVIFTDVIIFRDLFDIFRPIIYLLIILFPLIFNIKYNQLQKIVRFVCFLALLEVAINFFIFVDFGKPIINIYRVQTSGINYLRFSGTFGFAYTFSNFIFFLLLYSIFLYKVHKTKTLRILFSLFFLCILVSGSRVGIVALIIILFVIFIVENQIKELLFLLCFSLFLTFFLFIFLDKIYFDKVCSYFFRLIQLGVEDPSASHRFAELVLAKNILEKNLLFGEGSNKYYFNKILGLHLESLYAYYLAKWGLLGFLLYIFHLGLILFLNHKVMLHYRSDPYVYALSKSFFYWVLSIFIFGFSTSITDSYRGPFIFYTIVGYLLMLYCYRGRLNE